MKLLKPTAAEKVKRTKLLNNIRRWYECMPKVLARHTRLPRWKLAKLHAGNP